MAWSWFAHRPEAVPCPGVLHVAVIWTALVAVYSLTHVFLSRLARGWAERRQSASG